MTGSLRDQLRAELRAQWARQEDYLVDLLVRFIDDVRAVPVMPEDERDERTNSGECHVNALAWAPPGAWFLRLARAHIDPDLQHVALDPDPEWTGVTVSVYSTDWDASVQQRLRLLKEAMDAQDRVRAKRARMALVPYVRK